MGLRLPISKLRVVGHSFIQQIPRACPVLGIAVCPSWAGTSSDVTLPHVRAPGMPTHTHTTEPRAATRFCRMTSGGCCCLGSFPALHPWPDVSLSPSAPGASCLEQLRPLPSAFLAACQCPGQARPVLRSPAPGHSSRSLPRPGTRAQSMAGRGHISLPSWPGSRWPLFLSGLWRGHAAGASGRRAPEPGPLSRVLVKVGGGPSVSLISAGEVYAYS